MAATLNDDQLARHVYAALQTAGCPLLDGLYLQEMDCMLQLLCAPSQVRTAILTWICSSINPNFAKTMLVRSGGPDVLTKEMALLGQELMLCRAEDLDLIRGEASPHRQLQFLEQLLTLIPGCKESAGPRLDHELLLNELYAADNLPHFTQMLRPTLDPWPADIKALQGDTSSCCKPAGEQAADVATLLQQTRAALEQLQSECDFLSGEPCSPGVFSPSSLRVAVSDLQLFMSTFSQVYQTDMRASCSRDPPGCSPEAAVFQRTHRLLLAFITELEMLKEVSEASGSMKEEVNQLQTQPPGAQTRMLPNRLKELRRQLEDFLSRADGIPRPRPPDHQAPHK